MSAIISTINSTINHQQQNHLAIMMKLACATTALLMFIPSCEAVPLPTAPDATGGRVWSKAPIATPATTQSEAWLRAPLAHVQELLVDERIEMDKVRGKLKKLQAEVRAAEAAG